MTIKLVICFDKFIKVIEDEFKHESIIEIVDSYGAVKHSFPNMEAWLAEGRKVKTLQDLQRFYELYLYNDVYGWSDWLYEYCIVDSE